MQLIDTTDATSVLALSHLAMRNFLSEGRTALHLFGDTASPSSVIVRGGGMIVLHRADPRGLFELMRARSPVARLLQGFESLCAAYAGFTLDEHTRPVIKAHGATPVARRELSALGIDPLTSVEARALRDKLASVTKRTNQVSRQARRFR